MLHVLPPAALLLLNACIACALLVRSGRLPHARLALACAVAPAVYGLGSLLFIVFQEEKTGSSTREALFAALGGAPIVLIPAAIAATVIQERGSRVLLGVLAALAWLVVWVPRLEALPVLGPRSIEASQAGFLLAVSVAALLGLRRQESERGLERRLLAGSLPFLVAGAIGLLLKPAWAKISIFGTSVLLADEVVLLMLAAETGILEEPKREESWRALAVQAILLATGALLVITGAVNVGIFPRESGAVAVAVSVATGLSLAYGILRPSLELLVRNALYPESQRALERIRVLRAELEETRERLREAEHLSLVGQLAVEVAHEIKNPLGPIRGYAKIIERELEERGALTEVVARGIAVIRQEVEAIDARSRGLLELGRPQEPRLGPLDFASVVQDAVDLVRADCPSAVTIAWRVPPVASPGRSDPVLLRSALANVLANAIQAIAGTGRAGSIELELVSQEGKRILLVDDDGPGLPPAPLFRPFASYREGGHGLGLVIAR
ncbi:hypothetical protein HY251_11215, partial [bacterium]|nr:hypothetical protein [bacterium]